MASWLSRVLAQIGAQQAPQAEPYMENAGPFAGSVPAQEPVPAERGIGSRMMSGAARGGLVGGLVGAFADPETERGDDGANAYDATMGVVKSLGRGFVAGSGGDPYASERMDMQRESLGLQRENSLLARHRLMKEMSKEQRAEAMQEALSGIDPNTDREWRSKASKIAMQHGDPDLAIKLANAPQPKAPQVREFKDDHSILTKERQPDGSWKVLTTAPRYRPQTNIEVNTGPKLSDIGSMRSQFLKESQSFPKVRDSFERISDIVSKPPTAQNDISLVYSFMKMNDPTSAILPTEYATAQNAGGVPEWIRNLWNKTKDGTFLTADQRANISDTSNTLFQTRARRQLEIEGQFRGIAERNKIAPEDVVVDMLGSSRSRVTESSADLPAGIPAGSVLMGTSDGKPVYKTQDGRRLVVE